MISESPFDLTVHELICWYAYPGWLEYLPRWPRSDTLPLTRRAISILSFTDLFSHLLLLGTRTLSLILVGHQEIWLMLARSDCFMHVNSFSPHHGVWEGCDRHHLYLQKRKPRYGEDNLSKATHGKWLSRDVTQQLSLRDRALYCGNRKYLFYLQWCLRYPLVIVKCLCGR
jgi:hypothetical protein